MGELRGPCFRGPRSRLPFHDAPCLSCAGECAFRGSTRLWAHVLPVAQAPALRLGVCFPAIEFLPALGRLLMCWFPAAGSGWKRTQSIVFLTFSRPGLCHPLPSGKRLLHRLLAVGGGLPALSPDPVPAVGVPEAGGLPARPVHILDGVYTGAVFSGVSSASPQPPASGSKRTGHIASALDCFPGAAAGVARPGAPVRLPGPCRPSSH